MAAAQCSHRLEASLLKLAGVSGLQKLCFHAAIGKERQGLIPTWEGWTGIARGEFSPSPLMGRSGVLEYTKLAECVPSPGAGA